jgi:hypothetical protein
MRSFFLLTVLLFSLLSAQAQGPDRILLSIGEDPASGMGVSWRDDTTVTAGYVEVALAKAAPVVENLMRHDASLEKVDLDGKTSHYFSVKFSGLLPDTLYMYRVGNDKSRSEWFQFRTAAKTFKPFYFLYVGDAQNEHKTWWSRTIRAAFQTGPQAAFMLHAGDLINRANADQEWGDWFYAGGWMHGMIPSVATPGNHEFYRDAKGQETISKFWHPIFSLPDNGPDGLKEMTYYFDYQGVRVISISSESLQISAADSTSQVQWLDAVLKNNPNKWTILTMHHPIFSVGNGRDNEELRHALEPLFQKYSVDLVLTGHDHAYGRGIAEESPLRKSQPLKGPVYVVSVSGPKLYMPAFTPWLQRVASNTQLYQRVRVEADKLRVEAYTVTGELYDAFDIKKNRRGQKTLIDWAPGLMKERTELPYSYQGRLTPEQQKEFDEKREKYFKRKADQKN